jgi:demethylphylloquinone reductase
MVKPRVVILGGGFGGVFTALDLDDSNEVTLVSDSDHFLFTPMLYEYFSGEVEEWHIAPRYQELLAESTNLVVGKALNVDLKAKMVSVEGQRAGLNYDALVLAVGGTTNYSGVEGAEQYSVPFRSIANADTLRRRMIEALDRVPPDTPPQDVKRKLTFAVVGAGASGAELSTKMADLLRDAFQRRALPGQARVLLLEMGDRVVPGMGDEIRQYVERALLDAGVETHTVTRVTKISEQSITIEHDGKREEIETAAVVWTGGVKMRPLIAQLDVEKVKNGLLTIRPTLQLAEYDNIFALGDIAFFPDASPTLAGTAQLSFQEGKLAANNVNAFLKGKDLQTKHFEELGEAVSLGTNNAALLTAGHVIGGPVARQARFALYTARLPTWQHRLRVGASWFFEGTSPRSLLPLSFDN